MAIKISEGLTDSQIFDLINYSNTDPLIIETTSDKNRFKDINSFKIWVSKNRKIYALTDENEKLHGIIWFGYKKLPSNVKLPNGFKESNYRITVAIRIYKQLRGKGYANSFMTEALEKFKNTMIYKNSPAKGIWIITNSDNIPALKAYEKFGFKKIETINEINRTVLILN